MAGEPGGQGHAAKVYAACKQVRSSSPQCSSLVLHVRHHDPGKPLFAIVTYPAVMMAAGMFVPLLRMRMQRGTQTTCPCSLIADTTRTGLNIWKNSMLPCGEVGSSSIKVKKKREMLVVPKDSQEEGVKFNGDRICVECVYEFPPKKEEEGREAEEESRTEGLKKKVGAMRKR
eukprot:751357-Hanusia_phi.AAC.1